MTITFLIGNGFDINIGLKTRYVNFYNYYIKLTSQNNVINSFKSEIEKNIENWSDLELALGNHTEFIHDQLEFDTLFDDIREKLGEYLQKEENRFLYKFSDDSHKTLFSDLLNPERYLPRAENRVLGEFKNTFVNRNPWNINVITFNYSTAIDKIIYDLRDDKPLMNLKKTNEVVINETIHIHGHTNKGMILGVNDVSQIKNTNFQQDENIVGAFVKPIYNKEQKHLIDEDCANLIKISNLICLFGLSLGESDALWWELIGWHLTHSECRIILFEIGDDHTGNDIHKRVRIIKDIRKKFLSKIKVENNTSNWENRIFIAYNTDIFNLKPLTLNNDSKAAIATKELTKQTT
jgi:hypothetical protein